jgi:nitrate reductase cytochrome c-type subunit
LQLPWGELRLWNSFLQMGHFQQKSLCRTRRWRSRNHFCLKCHVLAYDTHPFEMSWFTEIKP